MRVASSVDMSTARDPLSFKENVELLEQTLQYKTERILDMEKRLEALEKEKLQLVQRIGVAEEEKEESLQYKTDRILDLERRLEASEKEKLQLVQRISAAEEEKKQTVEKLDSVSKEKDSYQMAYTKAQTEITTIQDQCHQKEQQLHLLSRQLSEMESEAADKTKKPKMLFRRLTNALTRKEQSKDVSPIGVSTLPESIPLSEATESVCRNGLRDTESSEIEPQSPVVTCVKKEESEDVLSVSQTLLMARKHLQHQELHLDELRCQLRREERVRTNLERLLLEGNELMHSLVVGCKTRLRSAQSSLLETTKVGWTVETEQLWVCELESIIAFLDKIPPPDASKTDEDDCIEPPLLPEEVRSESMKIV